MDTSVWYAAVDGAERSHSRAKELLSEEDSLVTSDHVLVETWRLLRQRISLPVAQAFWDGLRSGIATIVPTTSADLEVAWAIGERFPDQDFSIVDRTSFAVMERLGISRVASLDAAFAIYRYGRRRTTAFAVLR